MPPDPLLEAAKTKSVAQLLEENRLLEDELFNRSSWADKMIVYLVTAGILLNFLFIVYWVLRFLHLQ